MFLAGIEIFFGFVAGAILLALIVALFGGLYSACRTVIEKTFEKPCDCTFHRAQRDGATAAVSPQSASR